MKPTILAATAILLIVHSLLVTSLAIPLDLGLAVRHAGLAALLEESAPETVDLEKRRGGGGGGGRGGGGGGGGRSGSSSGGSTR